MPALVPILAASLLLAGAAGGVEVTACGETVPAGETGILQGDLVCSGNSGNVAITLESNATLDLNGFTLTAPDEDGAAVFCSHRACTVVSRAATPGTLSGASTGGFGIYANGSDTPTVRRVVIDNVVIRDVEYWGVWTPDVRLVTASHVTVSGCQRYGIGAEKLVVQAVVATANGYGIAGRDGVRGTDVTVSGNLFFGIDATGGTVRITGLRASANGKFGVFAQSVRLVDGQLAGSGVADVASTVRRPHLVNTTCETSTNRFSEGTPWGVCALDP